MALRNQITKLKQERAGKVAVARKVLDKATSENRSLKAEERGEYEEVMKSVDEMGARIADLERMLRAEDESKDAEDADRDDDSGKDDDEGKDGSGDERDEDGAFPADEDDKERSRHQRGANRRNRPRPGSDRRSILFSDSPEARSFIERRSALLATNGTEAQRADFARRSSTAYRLAFRRHLMDGLQAALNFRYEGRGVVADADVTGGYLVAPMQFIADLIKFVDNMVIIQGLATVHKLTNAQSLGAPSLDTDMADADWTSELKTGTEDSSMAFGRRELSPHPLSKRAKVSNKLLRIAAIGPEQLVLQRLGYKLGVSKEKAYMTGDGVNKPLGLFTASSKGISTGRDVVTGSNTAILADSLFNMFYGMKPQYQQTGQWLFHRDAVKQIRLLKDAENRYIWQPGLQDGEPDTLLGRKINQSEYVPNTFTAGNYVGLFGDLSYYWIAEAEDIAIQRLSELYAETNETGFIARVEVDAMPVLEEAFNRLKCST